MVVKGMYTLLGSIAIHLNDNLTDPLTGRVGSHIFGPDLEINTTKYMPKGQVTDAFRDEPSDYTFGAGPIKSKVNVINVVYYATKGDKYTENSIEYKDRRLVHLFLSKTEDILGSASGSFIGMHNPRFGRIDRVGYNSTTSTFIGMLPISYSYRE